MKKKNRDKSEQGFAIALSVLLLVVMSLMGASLIMVTSNDHKQNSNRDVYQQAFYAAESSLVIIGCIHSLNGLIINCCAIER